MQRLPRWPPRVNPFRVVIAVVVVAAVIIGYLLATRPPTPVPPNVVRPDDFVEVDYIGFFENGLVFDTSIQEVAEDNATYPKAVSFEFRPGPYTPFGFIVGGGGAIPGFEQGLLFPTPMREGEVRQVVVPPGLGYGPSDPSQIEVRPLREEIPQFETLLRTQFLGQFNENPVAGLSFSHPTWQWEVRVVEASADFVTIMHLPDPVGFLLRPFGAWDAQVVEVETSAELGQGRIVVLHLLTPGHVNAVQVREDGGRTFRIVNVDPVAGTYTVDFNREVVGQTLIFRLELLHIERR